MLGMAYLTSINLIQTYPAPGVSKDCGLVDLAGLFVGSTLKCFHVCPPPLLQVAQNNETSGAGASTSTYGPLAAHGSHHAMGTLKALARALGPLEPSPLRAFPSDVLEGLRGDPGKDRQNATALGAPMNFHHLRRLVIEATQAIYTESCLPSADANSSAA